eukprot:TRINITY_DN6112_c0_g1_i5.p1 TRINITY_DN6112_c0_g1~~TRINITY_DN6112_c0_g1_i5.p1  ORF type:complete len:584 (+),score=157.59 TRINITY_DN6112_c0_g1_i5:1-1752(+)
MSSPSSTSASTLASKSSASSSTLTSASASATASTAAKKKSQLASMAARRRAQQNRKRTKDVVVSDEVKFSELMLNPDVLRGLTEAGYEKPSPIQLKAIPLGRFGVDLLAQAKSGTGKTCVFGVIALESANPKADPGEVQVVILAPTREIAVQTSEVIREIGKYVYGVGVYTCIGGLPLSTDIQNLKSSHCQIVVGTPGRIQQLIAAKALRTDGVVLFVLDEADKLFEEGVFRHVIHAIFEAITTGDVSIAAEQSGTTWSASSEDGEQAPKKKQKTGAESSSETREKERRPVQVLSFSATYTDELLEDLGKRFMKDPQFVLLNSDSPSLEGVTQYVDRIDTNPRLMKNSLSSNEKDSNLISYDDMLPTDETDTTASTATGEKSNNQTTAVPYKMHLYDHRYFEEKIVRTLEILSKLSFHQSIVFCNEKNRAQEVWERLEAAGWPSAFIAGGQMDQQERLKSMEKLRKFEIRVLVSTDLIARGIDLDRINLVINMDVPKTADTYLHRVGRTGRFGTYGVSVTLVSSDEDVKRLDEIAALTRAPMTPLPFDCNIPEETYAYQLPTEEEKAALDRLKALQEKRKNKK